MARELVACGGTHPQSHGLLTLRVMLITSALDLKREFSLSKRAMLSLILAVTVPMSSISVAEARQGTVGPRESPA